MGLNFRKSIKIGGARVNLSKSGVGFSVGTKGARITKSAKGKTRTTFGIPGTGLSYSKTSGGKKKKMSTAQKKPGTTKTTKKSVNTLTEHSSSSEPIKKSWLSAIFFAVLAFALVGIMAFILLFIINAIVAIFNYGAATGNTARLILILVPLGLASLSAFVVFNYQKPEKAVDEESAHTIEHVSETNASKPDSEVKTYHVAGVSYYIDTLLSMMEPNELYSYKKQELIDTCHYDESIYKQTVNTEHLELIPEPDNPHDPNAIKVLLNSELVGYIAAKDCPHLLEVMDDDRFVSAHCEVYGGKYKRVNEDYDSIKDKSTYTMETGEDEYGIIIYIREKTEK